MKLTATSSLYPSCREIGSRFSSPKGSFTSHSRGQNAVPPLLANRDNSRHARSRVQNEFHGDERLAYSVATHHKLPTMASTFGQTSRPSGIYSTKDRTPIMALEVESKFLPTYVGISTSAMECWVKAINNTPDRMQSVLPPRSKHVKAGPFSLVRGKCAEGLLQMDETAGRFFRRHWLRRPIMPAFMIARIR